MEEEIICEDLRDKLTKFKKTRNEKRGTKYIANIVKNRENADDHKSKGVVLL
jgi:hypothetical protein